MEYNFREIEKKWQQVWKETGIYKVSNQSDKPKYYVLDMFPYPSGAGLHVGHPLGYIASDIFARFKKLKGFNVLHPMGFDAFGLPAEQYAIEHGIHPAVSTKQNIENFKKQLDKIGFSYDWSREVNTSNPKYYKWTQWIFLQLFNSFFNRKTQKAESIDELIKIFEKEGNKNNPISNSNFEIKTSNIQHPASNFSSDDWKNFDEKTKQDILMNYRLVYCGYGEVNWCEALGTVLANDEVINRVSERGGYPVVKKKLRQWYLRITEYADRLLEGLQSVDFSDAMKEMQTNWIGKSFGAEIKFSIFHSSFSIEVFTTRPDTIFGVDFMVLAPEHELVEKITTEQQKNAVEEYLNYVKTRNERERMAEKIITGVFTGAYAINPFNGREIPVWISEYVLANYGTGAIMAVPCGDERDFKFAKHFNIPITNIIGDYFNGKEANPTKDATLINSDFLDGIKMKDAIEIVIGQLEIVGIGKQKTNYKMRDAAFSRQRYWGEPIPIVWKDGIAYPLNENELPLELPHIENIIPGKDGESPLSNNEEWMFSPSFGGSRREANTMPGYAGSSWYFLRYMDPHDDKIFCDKKASDYWNQVDLYVGGTEHAVGHLLYSRMWTKFLYDLNYISFDEPYKKLVNQGMIQGVSALVKNIPNIAFGKANINISKEEVEIKNIESIFIDKNFSLKLPIDIIEVYLPIDYIEISNGEYYLTKEKLNDLKKRNPHFSNARFITKEDYSNLSNGRILNNEEDQQFKTDKILLESFVEKMSKSKLNVVNPDDIINKYGADTFRMYEMFLGPVEQSKPWDTKGIEGVHRFLKKLWRLFFDEQKGKIFSDEKPTDNELKILHKAIKKIEDDTERFSFNTVVSAFMVCVNELHEIKCHKKEILEPLLILLSPYAPHIAEELWHQLGNTSSIINANFPQLQENYLVESTKEYPVSINGKLRTTIQIDVNAAQEKVEQIVLANNVVKKWIDNKPLKKFIFVKGKMVNLVI
ncbi:MAG: leucine--tRNA ligase [Chitinophagaceae bacterium]